MDKSIQAIDKKSVHQICSGQVVLDLATAVKELVENAVDAGATNVEIKTKEYGKTSIEVIDNGKGIEKKDFDAIALKHYTSKIREFQDLEFVETFGFRGEALSSLSALSDLSITTKCEDVDVGCKLTFDHDGKLCDKTPVAHSQGTSVTVENIFYTLPVRYKEFHRNYKKDFTKLAHVLYAYSLIHSNVRLTFSNIVGKKKNMIFSTNGKNDILHIISNIFGPSQSKNIIAIEQSMPSETELEEYNILPKVISEIGDKFVISGYISKVLHGCGRSTPDRQFLSINKRPCDFAKLSRLINEVYHIFNRHQYPFVLLDISLTKSFVDVNITPDKRQIMIHQEKVLFAIVKHSLKNMFDKCATIFADHTQDMKSPSTTMILNDSTVKKCSPSVDSVFSDSDSTQSTPTSNSFASPLERFKHKYPSFASPISPTVKEQTTLTDFFKNEQQKRKIDTTSDEEERRDPPKKSKSIASENFLFSVFPRKVDTTNIDDCDLSTNSNISLKATDSIFDSKEKRINQKQCSDKGSKIQSSFGSKNRTNVVVDFDLISFRKDYQQYCKNSVNKSNLENISSFRAKISPADNETAESELDKHISKDMFSKMEIIGQFNLGFIITKFQNDLFIVDQHASDEKYNFETLQAKHRLKPQRLIQPINMELTLINRSILIDNLEIFHANGFDFDISNDDIHNSNEVKLTKVPTNRNWTFSSSDVEELIFMLSDSPGAMCRPSRVRQMFASRACRTSVMVGTALSQQAMRKLLVHMGEIEHPWNCPHGRPTMRHVINLLRISSDTC